MNSEILYYSRMQGLFAGINLSGGVVRPDNDDNHDLYGHDVAGRDVLMTGSIAPPSVTRPFITALRRAGRQ